MIEVADSNAAYYYHRACPELRRGDALGSVIALSDSTGDTVQTYEYSVFGEPAVEDANHTNPYMFAGRRYDIEIGLYYNRARYYNPYTGRFLQTDPIGYGDGMNMYAYCGNNPLSFVDSTGTRTSVTWDEVRIYAEAQWRAAFDADPCNRISDVEALARIADMVALWADDTTWTEATESYEFVKGLASLVCSETLSFSEIPSTGWIQKANDDIIGNFGQTGFKEIYQDESPQNSGNQVSHFVAYIQAGFYGGLGAAVAHLYNHERGQHEDGEIIDTADWRLGVKGAAIGQMLQYNGMSTIAGPGSIIFDTIGMDPSEVGTWIRDNLADPDWVPNRDWDPENDDPWER